MCERHCGWKNYPTWAVALWLDNDERLQAEAKRLITEGDDDFGAGAEALKMFITDANPVGDEANLWADLMGYALELVDWQEIADKFNEE